MRALSSLPLTDRGLHYGDGLFETMRVVDGHIRLLDRHLGRLVAGAGRLAIPLPPMDTLRSSLEHAAEGHRDGVLKLIVTRGAGGRGYLPDEHPDPSVVLLRYPAIDPDTVNAPVTVRLCDLRIARQPVLAGIKHLNRLEYVMARAEWRDPAIAEGLLLDTSGYLIEGVVSNVFFVREGRLFTPGLHQCGVAGVMRAHVMACAERLGIRVEEGGWRLDDLLCADEVFLTNSQSGMRPVVRLSGHRTWAVGDLTRQLQLALGADA